MNVRNAPRTIRRCTNQSLPEFAAPQSDKMSKMLESYAVILDPGLAHREAFLRLELIEGFELFQECRIELGRRLFNYRSLYKPQRIWTKLAEQLGSQIRRTSRTIFRLIEEYEESVNGKKPRRLPPTITPLDDAEEGDTSRITEEQVDFLEARRLLREAVAKWEGDKKLKVLIQAIQEEALASWGLYESFTLEINPCLPRIMLTDEEPIQPEQAAA